MTLTIFPCGCEVNKTYLTSIINKGKKCPLDLLKVNSCIPTQLFIDFLSKQKNLGQLTVVQNVGKGTELIKKVKQHLAQNEYEKAIKVFLVVIELEPNGEEAKNFIAFTSDYTKKNPSLLQPPNPPKALSFLKQGVKEKAPQIQRPFTKKNVEKLADENGYLPIHYAAMGGNVEQVKFLLKTDKSSLHAKSQNGATPLTVAIQNGCAAVVAFLLAEGASNSSLVEGYSDLQCALHHGFAEIALLLLDKRNFKETLNISSEEGGTPLMLACELDSLKLVKELVKKGALADITRKDGITALEISLKRDCYEVAEYLLTISTPSNHAIETVAKEGSVQMVKLLATHSRFYQFKNLYGDSPLHISVRFGNIPAAIFLAENGPPESIHVPNGGQETPFTLAISAGFWSLLEKFHQQGLFNKGVDITKHLPDLIRLGYHPFLQKLLDQCALTPNFIQKLFEIAAKAGHHDIMSLILIPKGAKPEILKGPNGWKSLHYLAKSDGIFLFKKLIANEKSILCPDAGQKTLPYIAAENGSMRVLFFLLDQIQLQSLSLKGHFKDRHLFYGVMDSCKEEVIDRVFKFFKGQNLQNEILDNQGTRPSHIAAKHGLKSILRLLHSRGADLKAEDNNECSPLFYAIRAGAKGAVTFLLNVVQVPVTAKALLVAACQKSDEMLKLLLKYTQDINVKTKKGNTALFLSMLSDQTLAFSRLLLNDASLMIPGEKGWLPLHLASYRGQHEMLEAILLRVPRDETLIEGNNPLHTACTRGHASCASLLIKANYSVDKKNGNGQTPQQLAKSQKGVTAALGIPDPLYKEHVQNFIMALKLNAIEKIELSIARLPLNEKILLVYEDRKILGTPLQLLLHVCNKNKGTFFTFILPLIEKILKEPDLDPKIIDNQGNTLLHLLLKARVSLEKIPDKLFNKFDLNAVNFDRQGLLHIAAQYASLKDLAVLFAKMSPEQGLDRKGQTPIFYAIEGEKLDNLNFLIEKGADLQQLDFHLTTPLLLACIKNLLNFAKAIIQGGADVNQGGTIYRISPLLVSMSAGNEEISFYLLGQGAKADIASVKGEYPVHMAAGKDQDHIVRFLAAKGYSLEVKTQKGEQPVHIAAQSGAINTIKALIALDKSVIDTPLDSSEQGINKENKKVSRVMERATPLFLAAFAGQFEMVKLLLKFGANPESKTNQSISVLSAASRSKPMLELLRKYGLTENPEHLRSALLFAIMHDNLDTTKTLYGWGVPYNAELEAGMTGLQVASKIGSLNCTQYLLDRRADPLLPNSDGETALAMAVVNNSPGQFSLLLEHCMRESDFEIDHINIRGETLFLLAAKAGKLENLLLLIANGASLLATDINNQSALHLAAREGHQEVVRLLLACGLTNSMRSSFGKLPSDLVSANNPALVKLIQDFHTLKMNAKKGQTLLHLAVESQYKLAVLLLCELIDLNLQDADEETALHVAARTGDLEIVKQLLLRGAKSLPNKNKQTPLDIACFETKNPMMTKFLFKAIQDAKMKEETRVKLLQRLSKENFPAKKELEKIFTTKNKM